VADAVKRAVDLLGAVLGLVVLAPLVLVIAAVLRYRCGSPVLFRQERAGRGGAPFTMVKFRTMRAPVTADEPDLPRTTPLGAALRTRSLDELPQLWNVLRGQMSLVGPRPTLPEQVARYSPRQAGRLGVRPGLSGWAQVCGRNSLSWPERIELDLWYVAHRSLRLDLRIIALSLLQVARPTGVTGAGGRNPGFPHPAPLGSRRVP
jgi:lipopolysaccharide/colanic/teichoic acid biosynthesis glycosyltransferase